MPIVIDRKTGEILSKPNYTQEQIDAAWEKMIKVWAQTHQDLLMDPEKLEEWLRRGTTVDPELNGEKKCADRDA